jgi:hypothetical protein
MAVLSLLKKLGKAVRMATDALFQKFPIVGTAPTSAGELPVPYHVYDGQGSLIAGTADLGSIRDLLQAENMSPMRTVSGKAVMGIWIIDFREASLGPHNEVQYVILAAHQPTEPVADHPMAMLKALIAEPAARMFSYRLWNNSQKGVAYNRELLGLNARLASGTITRFAGVKRFEFVDEDGELICEGDIRVSKRPSLQVGWSLFRLMGLRQTLRALREPYLEAKVVNPTGNRIRENQDAQTYLANESPVLQFFDQTADKLVLGKPFERAFGFRPQFIEHFDPFRFVYLNPHPVGKP